MIVPAFAALVLAALASPSPAPSTAPSLLLRRPDYAAFARDDPSLRVDSSKSLESGLVAYRVDRPGGISGFLEPTEGVVGRCGSKSFAAVPLDSGSEAGFSGWLLFAPPMRQHVTVVDASEALEFRGGEIYATNRSVDPATRSVTRRVDTIVCRGARFRLIGSKPLPAR